MSRHSAYMNMMQHVQDMNRRQPGNNNTANSRASANATDGAPATNTSETNEAPGNESAPTEPATENQQPRLQEPVVGTGNFVPPVFVNNLNPNMEFFMEVTPESITIDSLETTVVSSAQADNGKQNYIFTIF